MRAKTGTAAKVWLLTVLILRLKGTFLPAFCEGIGQILPGGALDLEVVEDAVYSVSQSGLIRHQENQDKLVFVPPFRITSLARTTVSEEGEGFLLAGGEPGVFGAVGFYAIDTGAFRSVRVGDDLVYDVGFSEKSGDVVVGCADGKVLSSGLSEVADGGLEVRMTHTAPVRAVAVSSDGRHLASAGLDGLVLLAELGSGDKPIPILDHTDKVESVVFTPNSEQLLSGGRDGKVRLHSLDGRLLRTFSKLGGLELPDPWERQNQILVLAPQPKGEFVLVGSSLGYVFRLSELGDTSEIIARFPNPVRAISVSETGVYVGTDRVRRLVD